VRTALFTGFILFFAANMAFADPAPVQVSLVSVCAKNEGRSHKYFEEGLAKVKQAVAPLSFDTFTKVSSAEATIPFGEKTTFFINGTYSLIIEPTSIDSNGRIRLHTQVMMKSTTKDEKKVKAMDTVLVMAPGKQLNLGGLKLADGELIIVLSVK
jgi:hypothetical protein